ATAITRAARTTAVAPDGVRARGRKARPIAASPRTNAWAGLQRFFVQPVSRSWPPTATAAETTNSPLAAHVPLEPGAPCAARGRARQTWKVSTYEDRKSTRLN